MVWPFLFSSEKKASETIERAVNRSLSSYNPFEAYDPLKAIKEHNRELKRKFIEFAGDKGVKGPTNYQEIMAGDMMVIPPASDALKEPVRAIWIKANEDFVLIEKVVKDNAAMVIYGIPTKDEVFREVELYRNLQRLFRWPVINDEYPLRFLQECELYCSSPVFYGPGDVIRIIFFPHSVEDYQRVSKTWFAGYTLIQDGDWGSTKGIKKE